MKRINSDDFKRISLDMAEKFANVCELYGLKYSIDYGTLLGAVRHNGFIPWDDDIDFTMPREDYEKLYQLFESNENLFGEDIKLASVKNRYSVQKPYYNLVKLDTVTISSSRRKRYYYPIWIDIFPVDNASSDMRLNQVVWEEYRKLLYKTWNAVTKIDFHNIYLIAVKIRDMINLKKNLLEMDLKCKSVQYTDCMINYMSPYGLKDVFDNEYFSDFTYVEFEKKKFRAPKNFANRLTTLYGDYMKLPPIEKRIPHVTDAYVK